MMGIVEATRQHPTIELGVSPRGSVMWFRACQALAFLEDRPYVIPDDAKTLAQPALAHRLVMTPGHPQGPTGASEILREIVEQVAVPV